MKGKSVMASGGILAVFAAAMLMGSIAPAAAQPICIEPYKPVCATKGKMQFTYANACFAKMDGAKVDYEGKCKPPKKAKAKKTKKKK
ncbi:MAG: hypothetical protein HXY30_02265 [Pseudorhodoplanes sp.]|nr:hypothetical protein [Pseudorhodoplanes sp.]